MKNSFRSCCKKIIMIKFLTFIILACFMFMPQLCQNKSFQWGCTGSEVVEVQQVSQWGYSGIMDELVATASTAQRIDARDSHTVNLLARVIAGEARGEPYLGKVAVGAVIVNRVQSPAFPNTLAGCVYQPLAFESVANGEYARPVDEESINAARQVMNGWDPTNGALYFWNPTKSVSPWIWTRTITMRIGDHVFGL